MLVTLTLRDTRTLELPVDSLTWSANLTGEHATARLTIPRGSAAWDPALLSERGGTWVEIYSGARGTWRGITDIPLFRAGGAQVDLLPPTQWLAARVVAPARQLLGLTAGAIARAALRDGLAGVGAAGLALGTFLEAGPCFTIYDFTGQSVYAVLADLARESGQEWAIDRRGRVSWLVREGRWRPELVVLDDGRLVPDSQRGTLLDTVAETTEVPITGVPYTARAGERPLLWPAQRSETHQ